MKVTSVGVTVTSLLSDTRGVTIRSVLGFAVISIVYSVLSPSSTLRLVLLTRMSCLSLICTVAATSVAGALGTELLRHHRCERDGVAVVVFAVEQCRERHRPLLVGPPAYVDGLGPASGAPSIV